MPKTSSRCLGVVNARWLAMEKQLGNGAEVVGAEEGEVGVVEEDGDVQGKW